jgi:ParB family chromosome partitioning protein
MAKLSQFVANAGMNSGAAVIARMMRTSEIQTDSALESIFVIKPETLAAITTSMQKSGYDKAEPIVVWKGKNIVVDGHTRLKAAIAAEIAEIPAEEKEFASLEAAKEYTKKRQINRRNLTQAEIFQAAAELPNKEGRDGSGRAAEILAKDLGISAATVNHARAVAATAAPEVIEQIKQNKMSINHAYNLSRKQAPLTKPAEFATIRTRVHQSVIQSIGDSQAAQAAFRELLSRLRSLETAGELTAPAYQDTAALVKPLVGADFFNSLANETVDASKGAGTTGDVIEN